LLSSFVFKLLDSLRIQNHLCSKHASKSIFS
jgi:hypothetical protein